MIVGNMIIARCWSGRFPGKVVAPLYGKPMVEWIIDKARSLDLEGGVVIAASDHPADQALENIAIRKGISCIRGPKYDLLARMEQAADSRGLTHWVEWFGDSPFADVRIARALVKAFREHPEVRGYDTGPYPSGLTGAAVSGRTRLSLTQARAWMEDPRVKAMIAEGWDWWCLQKVVPDAYQGETVAVDTTGLYNQCGSLFSTCIDYPLQLDFFNRICRYVGHFPTILEIERAHREMTTLGGEL